METKDGSTGYIHKRDTWHEGEKSVKLAKSTFQEGAKSEIQYKHLIHPNKNSHLPGYCGYVPKMPFNGGKTYGAITDKLTTLHTKNEKCQHSTTNAETVSGENVSLPALEGDQKYAPSMVPGYTGYVPQHNFEFGSTYREGTDRAMHKTKTAYSKRADDVEGLNEYTKSSTDLGPPLNYRSIGDKHPMISTKFMFDYYRPTNAEKRPFSEAPIPGYDGYVPQRENKILGKRYGVWSGQAFQASESLMQKTSATKPSTSQTKPKPIDLKQTQSNIGTIYNRHLGMVPKYTGYVPHRRFDFEKTYGDSTRSLPVCKDTNGYANGNYTDNQPSVTGTVIQVRDKFLHKQTALPCM